MINRIIVAFIIAVIAACATVSSPIGGDKDKVNPILISSEPKGEQKNYQKQEITLTFDEWVKVEQLKKELVITPKTNLKYDFTHKKEVVIINFKESLADSTTYTFNFRKSIKDITEGNLWENPTIAFSTGPFLDSMQIKGNVKELFTDKNVKNYIVGLYPANIDTANLREGYPLYFTNTDEQGNFILKNIKVGRYRVYTFSDKNDNLINNPANESYGFYPQIVNLRDSIHTISLKTYYSNEDTLKQKSYGPSGKDFKISYNKPLANYAISGFNKESKHIYSFLENNGMDIKVLNENYQDIKADSFPVKITVMDTIGAQLTDTVFLKFRISKIINDPLKIISKPDTKIFSGKQQFVIKFNKPIYTINTDSINIYAGDSIIIQTIKLKDIEISKHKNEITIETEVNEQRIDSAIQIHQTNLEELFKENMDSVTTESTAMKPRTTQLRPKLRLGHGAFVGMEADTAATQAYEIRFSDIEDYGTIEGSLYNGNTSYIVQLTNEKFETIDTIRTKSNYKFNKVKPGNYHVRIIVDNNENGQWDPGNPIALQAEEAIIHYQELITVKANWERREIDFNLSQLEIK